ncbi:nitroreductase family protein [Oceanimonas sp. MB9]|uniref:nitroreductase family protein n=1 Tax=Oceanimonas sp. MB9 TaxID=2588453 RepID=UPI0013F66A65|nr:nitroreductase family protein [Oceanimonas sp. MB9]NHI01060.1 putative NAD(P)H nitroreductase MhqN [Oceanimonas sp. MB9]
MHTLDAIMSRRAIKHYDATFHMPEADVERLFRHLLQAPTSYNLQHWRFVQVEDPQLRAELRVAAWDQAQITDASLLLVLCADTQAWQNDPGHCWRDAPADTRDLMLSMIHDFYAGKPQLQRDEAIRSVGIAAQTAMLAASAMGYDSCPMIGFDAECVAELIRLPPGHVVGMMLTIGKGTRAAHSRPGQRSLDAVRILNRF